MSIPKSSTIQLKPDLADQQLRADGWIHYVPFFTAVAVIVVGILTRPCNLRTGELYVMRQENQPSCAFCVFRG